MTIPHFLIHELTELVSKCRKAYNARCFNSETIELIQIEFLELKATSSLRLMPLVQHRKQRRMYPSAPTCGIKKALVQRLDASSQQAENPQHECNLAHPLGQR